MKSSLSLWFILAVPVGLCAQSVRITQGPKIEGVDSDGAVIAWSTDGQSNTIVHYGTNPNDLSLQASGPDSTGTHRIHLSPLHSATTYYFSVESGGAKSGVQNFTTKPPYGVEPPDRNPGDQRLLVGPVLQQVTDTSASIWWVGASGNKTRLVYGVQPNQFGQSSEQDVGMAQQQHHAVIEHLTPETTYYYAILNTDGKPLVNGQFITEAQGYRKNVWLTAGPVVEYLDSGSAVIAWSTSTNASTLVRYGQDPNNLGQNAQAPWGQETHRVRIGGLKPDSVYYFVCESGQGQGSGTMAKTNVGRFRTLKNGEPAMRDLIVAPKS